MADSTDDLVVRLQATLDEREREYQRVAEELREAARAKVSIPNALYLRTSVGEGLRLVQSHRDILDMYRKAKAQPVRREGREARLRGLDHASAMGRLTTLGLVLQTIARGYGIEDQAVQQERKGDTV